MKKIGIFPGSFNPIHKGHLKLMKFALKHLNLEYIYIVPCYKSVDKINQNYFPINLRINAIKLVQPKKTKLYLWEIEQKKSILTYKTINHIKQQHPNDQLFLLIGSDYKDDLFKWEGIEQIKEKTNICFFERTNHLFNEYQIKSNNKNIFFLNNPLWKYSSTNYRKKIKYQLPLIISIYIKCFSWYKKINI